MSPRKEPRKGPLLVEAIAAAKDASVAGLGKLPAAEGDAPEAPKPPPEKGMSLTVPPQGSGPHWKGRGIAAAAIARKEREAKANALPRDYLAEARKAVIDANAQERDPILAAVMIAQALDRLGKTVIEAAAIANYKRD